MSVNRTEEYTVENDEFSAEALDARPAQSTSTVIKSGWDSAFTSTPTKADYPVEFKFLDNKAQIIKFLDQSGPFAIYRQHFLTQKTEGKRSYICLEKNCPLCNPALNSPASVKHAFSVVNLSAEGGPQRQMLIASPRCFKAFHTAEHSEKGPLTNGYWAVSRYGKMQETGYNISFVKSRDLMEDYKIDETVAETVVASSKPFERSTIKESTWDELNTIANSLL
jgi:hypothetical protein